MREGLIIPINSAHKAQVHLCYKKEKKYTKREKQNPQFEHTRGKKKRKENRHRKHLTENLRLRNNISF